MTTPQLTACPEVCRIFCATANPARVLVAATVQGKGIMGMIDGNSPKGIEGDESKAARHAMPRKFGNKF